MKNAGKQNPNEKNPCGTNLSACQRIVSPTGDSLLTRKETRGRKILNLLGRRFGRLAVMAYAGKNKERKSLWQAVCDCGKIVTVSGNNLRTGNTCSCGCLKKELSAKRLTKHGETKGKRWSKEYQAWKNMKTRCYNTKTQYYPYYGGRGITVCDRWRNSFINFLADMGRCPFGLTLDRIDSNGNYEPSNCKWATRKEQANNKNQYGYLKKEDVR